MLVLFIAAAIRHQVIEERLQTSREMARRNEEGKARIARNWNDLPDRSPPAELASSPLARDLDLFGRASLFELLCTANTWEGRNAVARALLQGIEQDNLPNREASIRELTPNLEFRQLLECVTVPLRKSTISGKTLFTSFQVGSTLRQQRLLRWFCLASPFVVVILLGLNLAGFLPRWPSGLLLTLNYAVWFCWGRRIRKSFKSAISADKVIARYLLAFRYLAAESLSSPELVKLKTLSQEAFREMRRLEGLISLSRLPVSIPIPGVISLFNLLLLWDLHLAMAFEKWWKQNGKDFSRWLEALGKLEEIGSFASLLHDNPTWRFPEFVNDDRIVAEGLGHPLIPEATRVNNHVSVGPQGRILMVTGSQKIHFQETFVSNNGQLEMAFDYRIREGEAQSRNAIALMRHIGLELDAEV